MTNILAEEVGKYNDAWSLPEYAKNSPGETYAREMFADVTGIKKGDDSTVIDLGCGNGKGGHTLREMFDCDVVFLDFVDVLKYTDSGAFIEQSLWEEIPLYEATGQLGAQKFKYGFCCDVMEHIPPQFSMLAIHNMVDSCEKLFLSIAFLPDNFGKFVGKPLHLNVQDFVWWRDSLREVCKILDARDLMGEGVFYVTSK